VHRHHPARARGQQLAVHHKELVRIGPRRGHLTPPGERGGQLGRPDVDPVQHGPPVDQHPQRHHPHRVPLGETLRQVGGGVGDDGDGHER
jgi:hypothetical protein